MNEQKSCAWITRDELEYLDNIGTGNPALNLGKKELLRGYLSSSKRRRSWGVINKAKVVEHARELLDNLL